MCKVLAPGEQQLLVRLEARVGRGLAGTDDAIGALLEIHRHGLYLPAVADVAGDDDHRWLAYLARRWPSRQRHLYRLLALERVAANVVRDAHESRCDESSNDQNGHRPAASVPRPNEAQARELNRLPPSQQKECWAAVVQMARSEGQRPTAARVKKGVDQYLAATSDQDPTVEEVTAAAAERRRRAEAEKNQQTVDAFAKRTRKDARPLKIRFGDVVRQAMIDLEKLIADVYRVTGATP